MAESARPDPTRDLSMIALAAGMLVVGVLWAAGAASARLAGHRVPHGRPLGELAAFAHFSDPSLGWHAPVGPAGLYWTITLTFVAGFAALGFGARRVFHPQASGDRDDPDRIEGLAERREIIREASAKGLLRRAATLRPSVHHPRPGDVGIKLGGSAGVECWASVEDSITLLGPPRSGKGYQVVIGAILDYPGPVITTSTRADNLTATLAARAKIGPVAVFDPQGLAPGIPAAMRWSPVRGCERAQTAMIRAAALTAATSEGVTDGNYWEKQTRQAVRGLLHAAALGGRGAESLYEWSLSAPGAKEAVQILMNHPRAAPKWSVGLDAIISSDPKRRDDIWSMVSNAFGALADPKSLAAVSPSATEQFEPAGFLRAKGTLFLLGTAGSKEATGSAGLVTALIEDIIDVARRLAAGSPGSRLDPPLALILDEAANYPLPSLGALMSEGGGTGITTLAVFQSLAQVRHRWGRDEAQAIWDSSIVKLVLGGSSNPDDLAGLSRMIGERTVRERSETRQSGGGTSWSESDRQKPILEPAMIRTLRRGYALLLLRSAKPIMLRLQPWTARADAGHVQSDREAVEETIRDAARADWDDGHDQPPPS
jgi:type IV secretory pathway TraG/TraD family ATPase VirD4